MSSVLSSPAIRAGHGRALLPWAVLGLAAGLAFLVLADAVPEHDGPTLADRPVALWFAAHRGGVLPDLGLGVAAMTTPAVVGLLVAVAAALAYRRGLRLEALLLLAATAAGYAVGGVTKVVEHRARPAAPVNLAPETEPSFPSGHVLVVSVVVGTTLVLAWARLSRRARSAAVLAGSALVVLVGLDRLLVGAHWLTDVLASLALAGMLVAMVGVARTRTGAGGGSTEGMT